MKKVSGISLVALIITIIVLIILSGTVIMMLNKDGTIDKAKEATFRNDITTFNEELIQYILNKQADSLNTFEKEDLTEITYDRIKEIIKSFKKDYENKIIIYKGKLSIDLDKLDESERQFADKLNINSLTSEVTNEILPQDYQSIEYLQGNGSYIDLGLNMKSSLNFEIKCHVLNVRSTYIMGSRKESANKFYLVYSEGNYYRFGYYNNEIYLKPNIATPSVIKKIDNSIYQDDVLISSNLSTAQFTSNGKCLLFSVEEPTTVSTHGDMRIYYLKIWDNNTLIRNIIPCSRKSDNATGMYDTVNKVFYEY